MVPDIAIELGIFPLRTGHNVIVIVTYNICLYAVSPLYLGVVIGIVSNIAYVENPQGATELGRDLFDSRYLVGSEAPEVHLSNLIRSESRSFRQLVILISALVFAERLGKRRAFPINWSPDCGGMEQRRHVGQNRA